jgi:hypothetical protein
MVSVSLLLLRLLLLLLVFVSKLALPKTNPRAPRSLIEYSEHALEKDLGIM